MIVEYNTRSVKVKTKILVLYFFHSNAYFLESCKIILKVQIIKRRFPMLLNTIYVRIFI